MSDIAQLSAPARAFAEGPAEVAAARSLAGEREQDLQSLVTYLTEARQRAHLEALGEAQVPKAVKKAARKAAYQLKSAGVSGEAVRGQGLDLRAQVDLDQIAFVAGPGLRGESWLALGTLPDASGVEVVVAEGARIEQVQLIGGLTVGKMRKVLREAKEEAAATLPVIGDASLAVRLMDRLIEDVQASGGTFPDGWTQALRWRDEAVRLGADPSRWDARAQLSGAERPAALERTTERLRTARHAGIMQPPEAVVAALMEQLSAVLHGDEPLEQAEFRQRVEGLADSSADAWLADADVRARVARWLESDADVLLAAGDRDGALQALYVSDELSGGSLLPHEIGLVREAFQALIDVDAAWEHFQAHLRGEDHHHHGGHAHGHGHDHGHHHGHDHD